MRVFNMMDEERLRLLFEKYITKTATTEETQELLQTIAHLGERGNAYLQQISDQIGIPGNLSKELPEDISNQILDAIIQSNSTGDVFKKEELKISWWRKYKLQYAAAILLFVTLTGIIYFLLKKHDSIAVTALHNSQLTKDVLPGKNGAILTLSNGQTFLLDTMQNGALTTGITKSLGLVKVDSAIVLYATLSTPLGRQQRLQLSDGTDVWLNAGSSIRFPTTFSKKERVVEVTGEVYMEVHHDDMWPFLIKTKTDEIRDVGTKFDINAYPDEPASRITLIEGSVEVNKQVILKPNEEYTGGKVKKVDAETSIAWVSGYFNFDHADIETVMRQIARWYNVEVHYEDKMPEKKFDGQIQRSLKLSEVMELISNTGIHYRIHNNQLILGR